MKLVLIEWLDSYGSTTGWKELDECTPEVLTVRSVGWLLHDGHEVKVIIPHIVEPPSESRIATQGRGDMAIPCVAIMKIHELSDQMPEKDA